MADRPGGAFGLWLVLLIALGVPLAASLWSVAHVDTIAPGFALRSTGFEDGVQGPPVNFTLDDYRGRTVVLDLMAVSCVACAYVQRDVLKPLWAQHGNDTAFAMLSIDTWAAPETWQQASGDVGPWLGVESDATLIDLQNRTQAPWRHALDTDQVWQKYSAIALPRVVVVSADGRIVYQSSPFDDKPSLAAVETAVQASLVDRATSVPLLHLSLSGLAFVAGIASVLTPCSAGMLPAYFGMLLEEARAAPLGVRIRRSLMGGLAAAAGIVLLYALLSILFYLFEPQLRSVLPLVGPAVGFALVGVGALAIAGRGIPGLGRAGTMVDGQRGFFVFGLAFGLAGFGCTGPLFLPLLLAGFLESTAMGILLFILYASAVALVVVLVAALVAQGAVTRARKVLEWTPVIQRFAGALMAAAGLYLIYYFLAAPG